METETVPVIYHIDVEMDDQSGVTRFGPMSTKAAAESLLLVLSGRTDVKKATLVKEAVI